MATPEIEVEVHEVGETSVRSPWMADRLRRMLLASIGAVALTFDEVEGFVNRLVERGELAQKDGEKLLHEMRDRMRPSRPPVEKLGERMEQGVEELLNRLNIPSKRDIGDLSAKIAQLAARVEELRKNQG